MKLVHLFLLSFLMLVACSTEKQVSTNLLSENLSSKHPEWEASTDTLKEDFNIEFQGIKIPARVSWVIATDTAGCLRIGYFNLERLDAGEDIKFDNLSTDFISCGSNSIQSDDERMYETMLILGAITAKKGIKEYNFEGKIVQINGIGEYLANNQEIQNAEATTTPQQ